MTQKRTSTAKKRGLSPTEAADRNSRGLRIGYCFAFVSLLALGCGGCQTQWPPLPNPPGPHTPVRLSPGDEIKVAYAEESVPDQTQKIRRDGKVSLPLIGEVTAAGKRVIDFQHELVSRYEGQA